MTGEAAANSINLRRPLSIFLLVMLSACGQSMDKQGAAPEFQLPSVEGETMALSEYTQKGPVVLAFWATWCPPCVQEIPTLNEWQAEYADEGLTVLGINIDEEKEQILRFRQTNPINYPILIDEGGKVAEVYEITALPVVVVLAKGGEIIYYGFTLPDIQKLMVEARNKAV